MSAPSGSSRSTGPVSTSHVPATGHTPSKKRARKTVRRKVATAVPSSTATVKAKKTGATAGTTTGTDTKDVTARKATPAADATPATTPTSTPTTPAAVPQQKTDAEIQLEEAQAKQTRVLAKFWLFDQTAITEHLATLTPEQADILANKLQIVIKIKMPGSDEVVQLIPRLQGDDALGKDHEAAGYKFLHDGCKSLLDRMNATTPPKEMYDQYVLYRQEVFKWGREVATAKGEIFDYEKIYAKMFTSAFNQITNENNIEFKFSRGQPDPSRYRDPGDLSDPPAPPSAPKKKKDKKAANKAKVEFRIAADPNDLPGRAKRTREAEKRARAATDSGTDSYGTAPDSVTRIPNSSANHAGSSTHDDDTL